MDYTIKHVTTEQELDAALELDKRVFEVSSERSSPEYSREKWLSRIETHGDMMLYAEVDGEVVGIVFGRVEGENGATVGPVAVDERFRKHGIARALMLELERRAARHGIRHLALGAVETAEGFYAKMGYKGTLLLQSQKHSVEELLSLNTMYRVKSTGVYQGVVSQVFLELPVADREFQRYCEAALPGCHTQTVFNKNIYAEEIFMTTDIGNYREHARFWDWGGNDRTAEHEYWYNYAKRYGSSALIPMCALGETAAYMAQRGMRVTAFDITPEMISEAKTALGTCEACGFMKLMCGISAWASRPPTSAIALISGICCPSTM